MPNMFDRANEALSHFEFHTHPFARLLSFASLTVLTTLSCIPVLHVPVRNFLRPTVVYHVERGLLRVHQAQRFEHWVVTLLFDLSSRTVSVPFYVTFLPSLIWVSSVVQPCGLFPNRVASALSQQLTPFRVGRQSWGSV